METKRHRRGPGRERGRSQSMVQEGEDTGRGRLAASASSRQASTAELPTDGTVAQLAGQRRRSLRISRTGLDDGAGGGDDQATVRGELSSCACQPPPSSAQAERSEEHTSELQSHSFLSYAVFCL